MPNRERHATLSFDQGEGRRRQARGLFERSMKISEKAYLPNYPLVLEIREQIEGLR